MSSSDTSESDESLSDFQLTDNIKTENRPQAEKLSSSSSDESILPIHNTPSKKLSTGPTNSLAMNLQHYITKYDHRFVPHMEAAKALDEIESDDEVFIVQASTDFDLKEFANKKLSVKKVNNLETSDGRTVEYYIEDFVKAPNLTLIYGDKAGTNAMKVNTFKPEGKIIIQEKNVLTGNTETDALRIEPPQKVPFPKDLRIRHPLLGAFFEDKINLPPKVVKQLCSMRTIKKSKMENSVEKKSIKKEQADYVDSVVETQTKKHKKNKIKRERSIELEAGASNDVVVDSLEERITEPSPKKKKMKLEKFDDENDFSWLAEI